MNATSATAPAAVGPLPPAGVAAPSAPATPNDLLPEPGVAAEDALVSLYKLLSDANRADTATALGESSARQAEKQRRMDEYKAAVEQAKKAQEEEKGFFDSIGVAGLAGIAIGNPWLVIADMSMHMARLTPDFLRDFEAEHMDSIEMAAKAYAAFGNAEVLLRGINAGPECLAAAMALGGLLVQETELLGEDASDWVGRGMFVAGSGLTGHATPAAVASVADKEGAVADEVRHVERETREYTKWIAIAGMALAAAGAIVASAGTATLPVVAVGVALSAGGFAVMETKCFGDELSGWIGAGMMVTGAVLTGVGASNALAVASKAASAKDLAAKALLAGGTTLTSAAEAREGLEQIQAAGTQRAVDRANEDATRAQQATKRLERMIEEIVDTVRDLKDGFRRAASTVQQTLELHSQTQVTAAAGIRG